MIRGRQEVFRGALAAGDVGVFGAGVATVEVQVEARIHNLMDIIGSFGPLRGPQSLATPVANLTFLSTMRMLRLVLVTFGKHCHRLSLRLGPSVLRAGY